MLILHVYSVLDKACLTLMDRHMAPDGTEVKSVLAAVHSDADWPVGAHAQARWASGELWSILNAVEAVGWERAAE